MVLTSMWLACGVNPLAGSCSRLAGRLDAKDGCGAQNYGSGVLMKPIFVSPAFAASAIVSATVR